MTYRVEICFARSCKHQQNSVAFFPWFFLFFVFIPTEFTVTELCDDNAGTFDHFQLGANILLLDVKPAPCSGCFSIFKRYRN